MNSDLVLADDLCTAGIIAEPIKPRHLPEIEFVLADNIDVMRLIYAEPDISREALEYVSRSDLPPGGTRDNMRGFLLRARDTGTSAGFISFYLGYPSAQTFYIGSFFLARAFQNRGIGSQLVYSLGDHLVARGFNEARVAVSLKNWPALRFWLKMGYDRIENISGAADYSQSGFAHMELCHVFVLERN